MTAIVVSVVSVLGTLMGAALTAFVAARAEQHREDAQSRLQLNEAQVEHQRWRRERRQAAYLAFLEAVGAADRENQALFRELRARRSPVPLDAARIAAIRLKYKDSESSGLVVILEGPASVADATQNLVDQLSSLVQDVREYAEAAAADGLSDGGDTLHEAGMEFIAERNAFLGVARTALDDVAKHGQSLPSAH
ncbi:hypothetical protein [Streptomyces sp. SAS_276]|uniref:hypothetical protein n=1 Tax=Streptomyces sp. SAS_276 TaxID=3412745 RepID=UPI00403C6999